jgi:hypothetical protein
MLRNVRKYFLLTGQQQKLFFEAYLTLGFYRIAILTRSFKSLVSELHQNGKPIHAEFADEKKQLALIIGDAVTTAANQTPWQSACLVQALTAQRMLRKRKIAGRFHLGVTMNSADSDPNDPMTAHAWLVCGDEILTGRTGLENYTILSTFSWK